jgi:hypothetical protein
MGEAPQIGAAAAGLVSGAGASAATAAIAPTEAIAQHANTNPNTFLQFIL